MAKIFSEVAHFFNRRISYSDILSFNLKMAQMLPPTDSVNFKIYGDSNYRNRYRVLEIFRKTDGKSIGMMHVLLKMHAFLDSL